MDSSYEKTAWDPSKGKSLVYKYVGKTSKDDRTVSINGERLPLSRWVSARADGRTASNVNKANGAKWQGDNYDCKSFADQL